MNVAITGSRGNLGSVLSASMDQSKFKVFAIPSEFYRPHFQSNNLYDFLTENNISALIHCASLTNVDFSEAHREIAYDSNVSLTKKLSELAASLDVKMVFISSTGVYGSNSYSQDGPSRESSDAYPLNYYHSTKLQAELAVSASNINSLTLRVGWLFGTRSPSGKDFVLARIQEMAKLARTEEYYSNTEQFGNPTSCEFLAETISSLLVSDISGTINCVNDGAVSRYEFIRSIKELCGFEFKLVGKPDAFFPRVATVPLNEAGDTSKLASHANTRHWDEYLVQYCQKLRKDEWRV